MAFIVYIYYVSVRWRCPCTILFWLNVVMPNNKLIYYCEGVLVSGANLITNNYLTWWLKYTYILCYVFLKTQILIIWMVFCLKCINIALTTVIFLKAVAQTYKWDRKDDVSTNTHNRHYTYMLYYKNSVYLELNFIWVLSEGLTKPFNSYIHESKYNSYI